MLKTGRTILVGLLALSLGGGIVATGAPQSARAADLPQILPTPQQETAGGTAFSLRGTVPVVVGENTDKSAEDLLEKTIAAAGGTMRLTTTTPNADAVYLGTVGDNPQMAGVLNDIHLDGTTGITAEGYALGSGITGGHDVLALDGIDAAGTYYAVQTLTQIVENSTVPAVTVRDWPLMSIRGEIEGFYGIPWSHQARMDMMAFDGKHKMNTYIYTPKDDPYLRSQWRDLYPTDRLGQLKQLVDAANANHVNFTYALSPGNDICYSSDTDLKATETKLDQLRSLGVTSFYIALDDIPLNLHCAADKARWPDTGNWHYLADAQTYYLNRLVKDYIVPNHLQPLQTVPTNYSGSGPDPYKAEFGQTLDPSVRVQWTGEGVFSDQITLQSVTNAAHNYYTNHLYVWDNFPVNDGQRGRLFLNPLTGRDPDLYTVIDGITSNPMIEPYASMIALAGYGDYTWNSPKYDAATTQAAIIDELAGSDPAVRSALDAFVDLNQSWTPYRPSSKHAPELAADVDAFWKAYQVGDAVGMKPLEDRLATIAATPDTLKAMAQPGFYNDAEPWVDAAAHWANALQDEVASLTAIRAGQGEAATKSMLAAFGERDAALKPSVPDLGNNDQIVQDALVATVGDGVFQSFSDQAVAAYNTWLDANPVKAPASYTATPSSSMGTYSNYAVSNMTDGDLSTFYWSNQAPAAGDYVQVDLGAVKSVGSVAIHQSDSDTSTGDMLYHADLQYSADGTNWVTAANFDTAPLVSYSFDKPVEARYVRLVATDQNPGAKWVKIREFQVMPAQQAVSTNVPASGSSSALNAFDGSIATAFTAAAAPADGTYLARMFDKPTHIGSLTLVGTAAGRLQYQDANGWHDLGTIDPSKVFQEAKVDKDGVTAVRVVFAGDTVPNMYELVSRVGAPIADDPLIDAQPGTNPGGGSGTPGGSGTGSSGNGPVSTGPNGVGHASAPGEHGLASTGSDVLPFAALALLLAAAGAAMLVVRRRRRT